MKVSVEKEVVEKVLSVTIEVAGNKLTLNSKGILGLEEKEYPPVCIGDRNISELTGLPTYIYKVRHIYGECKVTEEVYLNCLKMMGN